MTASHPPHPGAHPDTETLAEFDEGLLDPPRAAEVWSHLTTCSACRADLAALHELPSRLSAARDVGRAPDALVARLDSVLAAEGRSATATITPLEAPRRRPGRDNRVLQAAAAAMLVLAATAIGVSALQNGGADDATVEGAAADRGARELTAGAVPVLSSGSDYTQQSVVVAVPRLLASDGPGVRLDSAAPQAAEKDDDARARLSTGSALSGCISAITDDPETPAIELPTPLVVDIAAFEGQAATVIVLPTPDETDYLDVYIVGPECGPADAKVLHFARVPRP